MNSNLIDSIVSLVWVAFAVIWILARFWKGFRGGKKTQNAPPPLPTKQPVQKSDASEPEQPNEPEDFFKEAAEAEPDTARPDPMPSEKAGKSRFPKDFRLSGEEWQQAVVLSEILGPPIALKDHENLMK